MAKRVNKQQDKSKPSYLYSIVSVTLVLFLLGALGVILINARNLTRQLKENVEITVILQDEARESEIISFRNSLEDRDQILSTRFISKEQAATDFKEEYGEDYLNVLDFNPLYSSIQVRLKHNEQTEIKEISRSIEKNKLVSEVFFQENLVEAINSNIKKLSLLMGIITAVFLFIAITLIDSTIKLMMYSNRFKIKTMQLVGATRKLITRPFISTSIKNGVLCGFLACILLILSLIFVDKSMPFLEMQNDVKHYAFICFSIIVVGIFISWWSTRTAVTKYLKMKLEDLY